jgi:hypothetical protein
MHAMFEDVLKRRFTDDQRKDVRGKLALFDDVSVNGQAVLNFYADRYIEEDEWLEVITDILTAPKDRKEICKAVTTAMRKFQLCGPPAKVPAGAVCGRAIASESFVRRIASLGYTLRAARLMMRDYKKLSVDDLKMLWRKVPLGTNVMWSSFAEPPNVRPFDGIPRRARDIAAIFGLPLAMKRKRLLLVEFTLPPTCKPCIPRVTEAYSGDTWVYYFRPASQEDGENGYGRTFVWDTHAASVRGRPEVVHVPIPAEHLASEPEEVS